MTTHLYSCLSLPFNIHLVGEVFPLPVNKTCMLHAYSSVKTALWLPLVTKHSINPEFKATSHLE